MSYRRLASIERGPIQAQLTLGSLHKMFPAWGKTLTLENGAEFAGHQRMAKETGIDVFFAHPYHP